MVAIGGSPAKNGKKASDIGNLEEPGRKFLPQKAN